MAKGSDVVIQMHFHPTGKHETERSTIGIYFAEAGASHARPDLETNDSNRKLTKTAADYSRTLEKQDAISSRAVGWGSLSACFV